MADRKPLLSRLAVRVALVAVLVYLGVVAVERYFVYCDYRMSMSPAAAFQRAVTTILDRDPPPERFFPDGNFTQIEPGLFVGGSVRTPPPGVSAVLNLCEIEDSYQVEVHRWMQIPDAEPAPDLDWLKEAVDYVTEQRKSGKTVYVHCAGGISRAAMVSTAYLMADRGWTRDRALAYIREQRPQVSPNPAFMDRLLEWEKKVVEK
jgi:Dual specificity phosphatase, catalytic domain